MSPDVTQAQRVRAILEGLQGGARTLFGRLIAGQLLSGIQHHGRVLPLVEYICAKRIEHFKEDDAVMRRKVDEEFLNLEVHPRESYDEFLLRYEDARGHQAVEGGRE